MIDSSISTVYSVSHSAISPFLLRFIKINPPNLSFDFILDFEKTQISEVVPGQMSVPSYKHFSLTSQVIHFIENEKTAKKSALHNFPQMNSNYLDKIQKLAFGYACICTSYRKFNTKIT